MAKNWNIPGTNIGGLGKHSSKFGLYVRVVGMQNTFNALLNKVNTIKGRTRPGIIKAIEYLEKKMDTTPPLVPVGPNVSRKGHRGGNLRRSFEYFESVLSTPDNPMFNFGYSQDPEPMGAEYVWYVHEMTVPPYTKPINWSRPGSSAKWFEIHLRTDRAEMIRIIENYVML